MGGIIIILTQEDSADEVTGYANVEVDKRLDIPGFSRTRLDCLLTRSDSSRLT